MLLLLALLFGSGSALHAQTFWIPGLAPYGPKDKLVATGDSTLLTTVQAGLLVSNNRGRTWQLALRCHGVGGLYAARRGQMLAGGLGKVYRSLNAGLSWDSVALPTAYPVTVLSETTTGALLAGTGLYAAQGVQRGDGVFYSADGGRTWEQRSTGFGPARYINQLTSDRHGRLFAAALSETTNDQPGLYTSADNGLSWRWLPVRINGRNAIFDDINTYEFTALAISPQDSLVASVSGSSGRVGVVLNMSKHLRDATDPSIRWRVHANPSTPMWWVDTDLGLIHFARNGYWYSSRFGTPRSGGTLVSQNQGATWALVTSGLGTSINGVREHQQFAEFPDGQVFMVQLLDETVYRTNVGLITSTPRSKRVAPVSLYPNPANEYVLVSLGTGWPVQQLRLYDVQGRLVRSYAPAPGQQTLRLNLGTQAAGMYVLAVHLANGQVVRQRLQKQ
ncbi:hypothetical protein ASU33_11095 [Solirubrum puertoriconensis]|uniref:Secretion system C-terminal sorting domain-containing protein n=1 Tax=Solirubrum puertoriconensis TaxID=1751427 RepID=A0A9X0HMI1_SOLP1|nr:hypothetical protein ASU33_11095 [Solirubrum puertoriconensis]